MSRPLIASIASRTPAAPACSAAHARFTAYSAAAVSSGSLARHDAGHEVNEAAIQRLPRTRARVSPSRGTRAWRPGMHAVPRSPRERSPDGLLNKTCRRPASCNRPRSSTGTRTGASSSTPVKPALAAALEPIESGSSVNSQFKLAENRNGTSEAPLDLAQSFSVNALVPSLPPRSRVRVSGLLPVRRSPR